LNANVQNQSHPGNFIRRHLITDFWPAASGHCEKQNTLGVATSKLLPVTGWRNRISSSPNPFEPSSVNGYDARRCPTPSSCASPSGSPGVAAASLRQIRWSARCW